MKFYNPKNRSVCRRLDRLGGLNAKRISKEGSAKLVRGAIDLQHSIASEHVWTIGTAFGLDTTSATPVLASAVHRNCFLFFSALKLNEMGLYGPARVLLRPAFEGLLIAKYCAISGDQQLLKRWSNGEPINLSGEVLRAIREPDPNELRDFWKHLCQYSHATIYAQQSKPTVDEQEVWETMWLIIILLQMNYHLLGRHLLTRGMVSQQRALRKPKTSQAGSMHAELALAGMSDASAAEFKAADPKLQGHLDTRTTEAA